MNYVYVSLYVKFYWIAHTRTYLSLRPPFSLSLFLALSRSLALSFSLYVGSGVCEVHDRKRGQCSRRRYTLNRGAAWFLHSRQQIVALATSGSRSFWLPACCYPGACKCAHHRHAGSRGHEPSVHRQRRTPNRASRMGRLAHQAASRWPHTPPRWYACAQARSHAQGHHYHC